MNVFVLCTGRCGSNTFVQACSHFTNFTAGHETRAHLLGDERLAYPDGHIEADNRLAWFLGRLESKYGDAPYYVHLTRDPEAVAVSYSQRFVAEGGIARAYRNAILMNHWRPPAIDPLEASRDYVRTVTENIGHFLRNKPRVMEFPVENAKALFPEFCRWISAEGDLPAALAEWDVRYKSGPPQEPGAVRRVLREMHATLLRR